MHRSVLLLFVQLYLRLAYEVLKRVSGTAHRYLILQV